MSRFTCFALAIAAYALPASAAQCPVNYRYVGPTQINAHGSCSTSIPGTGDLAADLNACLATPLATNCLQTARSQCFGSFTNQFNAQNAYCKSIGGRDAIIMWDLIQGDCQPRAVAFAPFGPETVGCGYSASMSQSGACCMYVRPIIKGRAEIVGQAE